MFYPNREKEAVGIFEESHISQVEFEVKGITCSGCEGHVEHAVSELSGIIEVKASFKEANTLIKFDSTQTKLAEIIEAIRTTDYEVGQSKMLE